MSDEMKDGGPAFPTMRSEVGGAFNGMSLRDYFAGQALLGILSGPASREGVPLKEWFDAPEHAYGLADAMLAARSIEEQAYAYEYGKSNGDGTFSVVIERGEPTKPVPDWPIKPLYARSLSA